MTGATVPTLPPVTSPPLPVVNTGVFTLLTTRTLDADGLQSGLDNYDLIRDFGGPNPIGATDLYPQNQRGVAHIYEDTEAAIGNHVLFTIHREIDIDRTEITDRQRNEIKTCASSEKAVKGFENETLSYRWKLRINDHMKVSSRFTHFFSSPISRSAKSCPAADRFLARHSVGKSCVSHDAMD